MLHNNDFYNEIVKDFYRGNSNATMSKKQIIRFLKSYGVDIKKECHLMGFFKFLYSGYKPLMICKVSLMGKYNIWM